MSICLCFDCRRGDRGGWCHQIMVVPYLWFRQILTTKWPLVIRHILLFVRTLGHFRNVILSSLAEVIVGIEWFIVWMIESAKSLPLNVLRWWWIHLLHLTLWKFCYFRKLYVTTSAQFLQLDKLLWLCSRVSLLLLFHYLWKFKCGTVCFHCSTTFD